MSNALQQIVDSLQRRCAILEAAVGDIQADIDRNSTKAAAREARAALNAQASIANLEHATPAIISIVRDAAALTGTPIVLIIGPCRQADLFKLRCAIALVAYVNLGATPTLIARVLGDRDHKTIVHALKRARSLCEIDSDFELFVNTLGDRAARRAMK